MSDQKTTDKKMAGSAKISVWWYVIPLLLLIGIAAGISVSVGQVRIPVNLSFRIIIAQMTGINIGDPLELSQNSMVDIIWLIRFPRVLMAILIGAGLAMSGVVMQASVQNPLADPYILGISAGAALGATFAILIGFGKGIVFWSFLGSLAAIAAVLVLASMGGKMSSVKLVLAGMVMNALCNAFSNFIIYLANNAEGIRTVTFWMMGSLTLAKWSDILPLAIVISLAGGYFILQSRNLNVMLLGDETATTLGLDLNRSRRIYLLITSVLTAIIVAKCGIIGFVGLVIPHIVRSVVGSDHKKLLPISILLGALLLLLADLIARTALAVGEIPIGIVTALLGAPVFMYILVKNNYGFGGK